MEVRYDGEGWRVEKKFEESLKSPDPFYAPLKKYACSSNAGWGVVEFLSLNYNKPLTILMQKIQILYNLQFK